MSRRLLREFSMGDYLLSILYRAVLVGVMIFSSLHYYENQTAFWVISFLCFPPLIFIGCDEIIVFENKVVQKKNSIASFFKIQERVYYVDDMSFATLSIPKQSTTGEIAGVVVMTLLSPMSHLGSKRRNPIVFRLINGETIYFLTSISPARMQKVVDTVNELIYQKENGPSRWGNVDEYLNDIN